jgi:predicted nucleic acid-binding Zn finger protein
MIDVWLSRLDHTEILAYNSWILAEYKSGDGHPAGVQRLKASYFRTHLAYVNEEGFIHMDETGEEVTTSTHIFFRFESIRMGTYVLDINRRHCSCKSYQYLQTEHGDRNCKHLNSLCKPSYAVIYTKQPQAFQLISENVPKQASVYMDWIYSQKHDGIRVRVEGTSAWTRGGMKFDLGSIWTPPVGHIYDAELCMVGEDTGNHDDVLASLLAGKLRSLRLLLFDIFDTTGKMTCAQRLTRLWSLPIPVEYLVRYQMVHLWRGPSFHDRLTTLNIGSTTCEGVVVRNPKALYDGSGHRSSRSIFKIKRMQWDRLNRSNNSSGIRWL